jgi:Domain of unknown function (DUF1833)
VNGYPYSQKWHEITHSSGACETPKVAIEITHPALSDSGRFVNDTEDVTINGKRFIATQVQITWPDDKEDSLPRANLILGNNDKSVGLMFEKAHGAKGAKVKFYQFLRSQLPAIEKTYTLDLLGVDLSATQVSISLGLEDLLNKIAIPYTYRPKTKPGLS